MLEFASGDRLRAAAAAIAEATVARDYAARPALLERYGESGRSRYREDVVHDVAALAAAVDAADEGLFVDYVGWLKIVLVNRGVAAGDIAESLRCLDFALANAAGGEYARALGPLRTALARLDAMPTQSASLIAEASAEHEIARNCLEALLRLDAGAARAVLEDALAAGMPLARIYAGVVPPLMREVGRRWQTNEISVAHEHYCSAAVQSILGGFHRLIFKHGNAAGPSIMVACVEGEQHELGARTVADVFELSGWHTSFLGANLPARDLVKLIEEAARRPDVIALSATMPGHLARLAATIEAIRDSTGVPVMVGGYLFDARLSLAERLDADGCAADAEAAVSIANALVATEA